MDIWRLVVADTYEYTHQPTNEELLFFLRIIPTALELIFSLQADWVSHLVGIARIYHEALAISEDILRQTASGRRYEPILSRRCRHRRFGTPLFPHRGARITELRQPPQSLGDFHADGFFATCQ